MTCCTEGEPHPNQPVPNMHNVIKYLGLVTSLPGEPHIAFGFREFPGVAESATYIAVSVAPMKKLVPVYGVLDVIIFQHSALVLEWKFVFHPGCVFQLISCIVLILYHMGRLLIRGFYS